jgi:hypothetical protein
MNTLDNSLSSKRGLAYVRISSKRQVNNESPETQKEAIQRYADSENISIVDWYFDEAKSGKNTDREELQNLLKRAIDKKDQIDHVIVYKMNRASRDLDTYVSGVRTVLKTAGITMRSATEPIDDTKTGRFLESLMVLLGQLDNDGKTEYTVDNMTALAMQGYWQQVEETAKVMTQDGFFKTGDIGFQDKKGYFQIVDRKKVGFPVPLTKWFDNLEELANLLLKDAYWLKEGVYEDLVNTARNEARSGQILWMFINIELFRKIYFKKQWKW